MRVEVKINEPYVIYIMRGKVRGKQKQFKGIAKCSEGDIFNKDYGTILARKRAFLQKEKYILSIERKKLDWFNREMTKQRKIWEEQVRNVERIVKEEIIIHYQEIKL